MALLGPVYQGSNNVARLIKKQTEDQQRYVAPAPPKQTLFDSIRDIFDANSAMDRYKRQRQGLSADYATAQRSLGLDAQTNPFAKVVKPVVDTAGGYVQGITKPIVDVVQDVPTLARAGYHGVLSVPETISGLQKYGIRGSAPNKEAELSTAAFNQSNMNRFLFSPYQQEADKAKGQSIINQLKASGKGLARAAASAYNELGTYATLPLTVGTVIDPKKASLAQKVIAGTKGGAVYGGASGVSEPLAQGNFNAGELASQGAQGAAAGAALGGALPLAGAGIKAAGSGAKTAIAGMQSIANPKVAVAAKELPNTKVRIDPATGKKVFAPTYNLDKKPVSNSGQVNENFDLGGMKRKGGALDYLSDEARNKKTRFISQRELDYYQKNGHLPTNEEGYTNIIMPGGGSKVRNIGDSKKYLVTFKDELPVKDAANGQGAIKGKIKAKYIERIDPAVERGPLLSKPINENVPKDVQAQIKAAEAPQKPQVELKNGLLTQAKTAMIDKNTPVLQALRAYEKKTGKKGMVDKFIYDTGLLERSNSIANAKASSNKNLRAALEGLGGKDLERFNQYAAARSELFNARQGMPTSVPVEQLQKTYDTLHGQFGGRFDSMNKYYQNWAKDLYKAGIIDETKYKQFISNPDYIRTQRDMADLVGQSFSGGSSYSLGSTMASQKRKGSSREMQPADITALDYAQKAQKEIQRNQVATNMIDSLKEMGLATPVPQSRAANKNTIRRIVNGKVEVFEVPAEIKQVADNMSPYQLNVLERIVSAPKRLFQAGTTGLSAPFAAANYVKDQATSAINSKNVMATHDPRNIIGGLWQATKDFGVENHDPIWNKFLKYSGDTTQFDLTRNAASARKMSRELRLGNKGRVINRALQPVRTLEDLVSITEKATRFQNFKGVYEDALKKGASKEQATQQAVLAAWNNTVDFNRAGTWSKALNLLIPYFNSGIQGSRRLVQTYKDAPVAATMKTMAFLGMPLIASTAYNLSNPDTKKIYDNISQFEKDNNLILIPPGAKQNKDGTYDVIKVPLPQGYNDLINPIRRTMEAFANNEPTPFGQIAGDILDSMSGPINLVHPEQNVSSLMPAGIKPVVQQMANKDFFTNQPIVPDYVDNATDAAGNPVPESKKSLTYTSGTADLLGQATGVSPIRIEKFIKDVAGKIGQYGLNASDNALAKAGVIGEDKIGGVSIAKDISRRFSKAQGEYNYMKSDAGKYYDRVTAATKDLNPNEKAAYGTLHPSKTNFLGEEIFDPNKRLTAYTRAGIYLQYPKVYAADKAIDAQGRAEGKPGNPLYDLTPEQLTRVLLKATLPPGSKDPELSALYQQDWYQDYNIKRNAYYQAIAKQMQASGKQMPASDNPYPQTPPDLQQAMDAYSALPKGTGQRSAWIKANSNVWQRMTDQWTAVDAWENKERVSMGLSPIDSTQTASSSFGGGSRSSKLKATYGESLRNPGKIKAVAIKKFSAPSYAKSKAQAKSTGKAKVSIKKSLV